ncbi:hypothetical protein DFR50_10110 [Roseiarcus fermentans]|uniref:Type II CBASS E2 protein domain-containing protein n=1 Tax=Roseiarcus fermentans TaxID=1473586 RepID=A0A366FTW9_9HYPH|nr:hypothetical protein [Roseiarcus fermentans]RBP18068.1 hypothetical protein DFR50_10110 [Roseiarcus fermentans]
MRPGIARALTASQQFLNLRGNPICAGQGTLRAGALQWCFRTSPSSLSRSYDARLEFRQGSAPETFIDAPDLVVLANGRVLPHVYSQMPTRLCLYLPRAFEWQPWLRLDQTIVPWTALWLYFFEEWLATNEWKGGGEHPRPRGGGRRRDQGIRKTEIADDTPTSEAPARRAGAGDGF